MFQLIVFVSNRIGKISIKFRISTSGDKLVDFYIYITDKKRKPQNIVCAEVSNKFVGREKFECEEAILGTEVIIKMKDLGMKRTLTLCEVEVYAEDACKDCIKIIL